MLCPRLVTRSSPTPGGRAASLGERLALVSLLAGLAFAIPVVLDRPLLAAAPVPQEEKEGGDDFPPFEKVTSGYTQVVSTADGAAGMYNIWVREKDGQMLAELPRNFDKKRYFIALTVASGERFAGLQAGDIYVYWRRYGNRLALIEPNLGTRSTGDQESKDSVRRLFTDRVILDLPILTVRPRGGPVIDMDELLLGNARAFFGNSVATLNRRLSTVKTAKAFPQNVELGFEVPLTDGVLKTLHYSISEIPDNTGYKPRVADTRVGYFVTSFQDLGKYTDEQTWTRYINRWHLEKADPKLKLSPPKEPLVFYIEHTTPIRYRRFVRDGVLYWNQAFERIGLLNALEVRYQDAGTGAHMDKDPEDVRYNFVRWLNNDVGTAIGPSRVHPLTGQILDADIVLTDGWIRAFEFQFSDLLPRIAMEGFGPDTLAWLAEHPEWDPRILLADPHERATLLHDRHVCGHQPFGGHPMGNLKTHLLGDDEYDGLMDRTSQVNGMCMAAGSKAFDLALMRMGMELLRDEEVKPTPPEAEPDDVLDGMPARFIGPLLADLVAHEVGHTLGLRHNFRASALYTLDQINSDEVRGKKPFAASVMDYNPTNIALDPAHQGDYAMIAVGPYDEWAIEYGYSLDEKKLPAILARSPEPELQYATDEDTGGPDPLARRYDFSANPLEYARSEMRLVEHHRKHLLERFVKDGESWAKARRGYDLTLSMQARSLSMMANWVGGAFVYRDKKGDKGGRAPIEPVPTQMQRDALDFVIENGFRDAAYGLDSELLRHLTVDKWFDAGGFRAAMQDATYPINDRILSIQASVLTMLLNPTTLQRVYDNEHRMETDAECLTLPELLTRLNQEIWSDLAQPSNGSSSLRQPVISHLRRNLQRTHLDRLIDIGLRSGGSAAYKTIASLVTLQLRELEQAVSDTLSRRADGMDPYTRAHLTDALIRVQKALEAKYIVQ